MSLPADVEAVLRASGWEPARRVDVSATVEALQGAGYAVVEPAKSFLAEFMGLRLTGSAIQAHFDPLAARGLRSSDSFMYSKWHAAPLTPIGEVIGDSLLLIDDSGRVFAGYANSISDMGGTVIEALTTICRGGRAPWVRVDTA